MLQDKRGPHLADAGALPEYPVELIDARMTSDYFTMFWHDRWLNSELHLTAPLDVQGAALNLFFIARKQNPIGSLPDNDAMLSKLLRIDLAAWVDLRQRSVGPLHNWSPYRVDGKIVLGHPVVIEVAMDALNRRSIREASNAEKAVNTRLKRLAEAMLAIGGAEGLVNDKVLMGRIDAWLLENHRGQRRMPQFEKSLRRALNHALEQGWIGKRS